MCGITGFWDIKSGLSKEALLNLAEKMAQKIAERGPDSFGSWCDESLGLAFGHRRLSIVDLSPNGHQPMVSSSDRMVLSYNGEIYNTAELRAELERANPNLRFRGNSDTEVILEGCQHWGVEATCKRLIGMFAFSLWDREDKKLYLVRDRLGIKPLYWGFHRGVLFFGSQPKSFAPHPKWQPEIDQSALTAYFRYNYVPTPFSIFKDIQKLNPGSILSIDQAGNKKETRFWSFEEVAEKAIMARQRKSIQSEHELIEDLDTLLRDAVKRRMVADVPLGAFLSGGIDSSTVVALMQAQSKQPIKTFSIGFHEQAYDEAQYAARIAKHLGTDHHELYVTDSAAQAVIPSIPTWCDEPFADSSQIPTFLVSQLARQHVTVSLSGDGGDELFAGYNRYFIGHALWQKMKFLPSWLKQTAAAGILKIPPSQWDKLFRFVPQAVRPRLAGDKLHKLANVLKFPSSELFYRMLVSQWEAPHELLLGNVLEPQFYPWTSSKLPPTEQFIERMQCMDILSYLPDDILAKVDRASMAVSLEARVPLLDHRLVEFSWQLPFAMKYRRGQGKWILRQVLNKYVPKEFFERPKMGFGVPIDVWLRGPLREWAEHLLSEERIKADGILNPTPIRQRWQEHLSGQRNWHYSLWGVLMFQAWKERWGF